VKIKLISTGMSKIISMLYLN